MLTFIAGWVLGGFCGMAIAALMFYAGRGDGGDRAL